MPPRINERGEIIDDDQGRRPNDRSQTEEIIGIINAGNIQDSDGSNDPRTRTARTARTANRPNTAIYLIIAFIVLVIGTPIYNSVFNQQVGSLNNQSSQSGQTEQPQSSQTTGEVYYVATDSNNNLFIRNSPGRSNKPSGDILTRVPRGTALEVLNKHGNSNKIDGYTWWEVKVLDSGLTGWAASDYLSASKITSSNSQGAASNAESENSVYYVITSSPNNLFVRKSAGTANKPSSDILARIRRGTEVVVLNKRNNQVRVDNFTWWEVRVPSRGINGWVASEYLSKNKSDVY